MYVANHKARPIISALRYSHYFLIKTELDINIMTLDEITIILSTALKIYRLTGSTVSILISMVPEIGDSIPSTDTTIMY